jgi:hypothetical protein
MEVKPNHCHRLEWRDERGTSMCAVARRAAWFPIAKYHSWAMENEECHGWVAKCGSGLETVPLSGGAIVTSRASPPYCHPSALCKQ